MLGIVAFGVKQKLFVSGILHYAQQKLGLWGGEVHSNKTHTNSMVVKSKCKRKRFTVLLPK